MEGPKLLTVLVIFGWISAGKCQNTSATMNNYTFTYKMAAKCKEYISQHGYKYEKYFKAETDVTAPKDSGVLFEMHLAILASSNGHILLSSIPEPTPADPVYEFVIGGGGNKFTELRRNLRKNAKGSVITRGILSPIEFRAFYIKIDESGTVQFGKEGDPLPIINYVDIDPIPIRYFSFASWKDEAKYLFDCPVALANGTEIASPDSEETEANITVSEKLKQSLLKARPVTMPPAAIVNVDIGVIVTSVKYDAFASKLTTEFAMILVWGDDGLAWNPQKFNNTKLLTLKPSEIWKPTFIEASSINTGPLDGTSSANPSIIHLNYTGILIYVYQNKLETWCDDLSNKLNRWPNDEYTCQMVIEPWNTHELIKLGYANFKIGALTAKIQNGWEMSESQEIINRTVWNTLYTHDYDTDLDFDDDISIIQTYMNGEEDFLSDRLIVNIHLKRIGTAYNIVFYVPLIVLMTFVLVSFWTSPLTMSRVWFFAGASTFISFGLSYVDYFLPCHTVPSILILYTCVLAGTLLALVINVALIQAPEQKVFKNRYVQAMLTMKAFRSMFCLPDLKTCQLYETIEEDQSNMELSRSVEAMQDDENPATEREECAEVIDKILFTVYSVLFSVLLACHY